MGLDPLLRKCHNRAHRRRPATTASFCCLLLLRSSSAAALRQVLLGCVVFFLGKCLSLIVITSQLKKSNSVLVRFMNLKKKKLLEVLEDFDV